MSTETRVPTTEGVSDDTSKARSAISRGNPVTSGTLPTREFVQYTEAAIAAAMSATLTAVAMIAERGMSARLLVGVNMPGSIAIQMPGLSGRAAAGMLLIRM
jgi:hypothetical protein